MREALDLVLRTNVVGALAVLLVLAVRLPARAWFGPRIAYGLWSLAPLAVLASLLPARTVTMVVNAPPAVAAEIVAASRVVAPSAAPADLSGLVVGLWLAGALACLGWLAWKQAEFGRAAKDGLAGPAVIGVLRPRIVTPGDFARRYTAREQQVVLAHEAAHIARHDPRINALVALARCVAWFNPLVHVLAHYQRIDQELACDAAVVAAHPQARRSYAEAMLKTQLASRPLPLGCYWPAPGLHPLAERVSLLASAGPSAAQRRLGVAVVALLGSATVGSAWASKPAEVLMVERAALHAAAVAEEAVAPQPAPAAPSTKRQAKAPTPQPGTAPEPPASPDAVGSAAQAMADADAAAILPRADRTRAYVEPRRERKIYAAAERSRVTPGSAVRLVATMTDPEGKPLMTDLTAFGSQHFYRKGRFMRDGSRLVLFTGVVQDGDTLWVTASTNSDFHGPGVGTIAMKSGETRDMVLGDGQVVTVTPTLRPETPEEMAGSRPYLRNVGIEIDRESRARWRALRDRS